MQRFRARLRRETSAHRTTGPGCSWSRGDYPTPPASTYGSSQNGSNSDRPSAGTPSLETWARTWPTPLAADAQQRGTPPPAPGRGRQLTAEAANWPTPLASDAERSGVVGEATAARNSRPLREAVASWPTPLASDSTKGSKGSAASEGGPNLPSVALNWPTPCAIDGAGASRGARTPGDGGGSLPHAVENWPTPTASDSRDSRRHGYTDQGHPGTTLLDAVLSHLGLTTGPGGSNGSAPAVLNPRFVESLMGFPPGWVNNLRAQLLLPLASLPTTQSSSAYGEHEAVVLCDAGERPDVVRIDDGEPRDVGEVLAEGDAEDNRQARLAALGNAVMPQCAEVVGHVIAELLGWSEPEP